MRVAVVSDIHGNLHALEAVLEAIDRDAPDELWCLGDLVGYGPRPNRCCALMAERADVCLIGNHDLAALGRLDLAIFSPDAALSAAWTAACLEPETRAFLEPLEPRGRARRHRPLPRKPPRPGLGVRPLARHRVRGPGRDAARARARRPQPRRAPLPPRHDDAGDREAGTELELADDRWLLNPGSVGQPRDGDPRAAWLLLDLEAGKATFRRETYDVGATQAEIRERGLPEALAARLEHGV